MEGTGAKHSEGQIDPKDLQRFEELRQARAAMQTAGTHMTPEGLHPDYSKNWTEAEGIKNKYGGMPPASVKGESGGGTPYKTEATPVAVADHINSDKATTGEVKQTTSKELGKLGRMTGSVLDNLRSVAHEGAKHLANAYQRALDYHQHLIGKYVTPTILSGKKMTNEERLSVNKATEQYRVNKVSNPQGLSERAQAFFNAGKAKLDQFADEHIANKMPITDKNGNNRAMIKKENYWPTMWSQQVENMFRKGSDTEGISKAKKEFLDYNTSVLGKTKEEALDRFNSLQQAMASNFNSARISHQDWFNALRKPLGDPLPPTWREQDPVRNLARYFDRASMAMSHYAKVESDPKAMAALGVKKNAWGHDIPQYKEGAVASPYAHAAVAQYHSIPEDLTEQTEKGFSSLATALFIANPGLEIHKIGSNFSQAMLLADNPYQAVRALGHAVMNMRDGWGHALEGGLIKLPATRAVDMLNNSLTTQQRMSAVAKVVRDISTFGGLTTRCNAAFQQMYFEHLLPNKIIRANSGDKNAQMQLKHWDADYKIGKTYSPAEIQQLASTVASYAHGTGDIRQMPAWMKNDSEISGFFQLAHWSVAQTNNFMHNVWMPAKRGNFTPLITGMVGSALAGYAIKDLREKLQGKHGQIPSLSEIAASDKGLQGNAPLLMYNAIAGMQYAGFGGLFSQVVKGAFDVAYKNNPQGATFPLEEIASDTIHSVNEAMTAIANDPNVNYADLAAKVSQHLLGANIKLAQIALNTGINTGMVTGMPAEKKMLADKLGQLRRFDMVSGLPYNEVDQGSNPYMNIEQSKFRMTQDVGQAMAMLPGLISNIMTKYHDNPDVLMQKIKALKENQYDTFPSMETVPLSFYKYLGYLQKEEGPEAAQAQLQDYMKHKAINEAKGSVVP
jgi:hypothetical protein